MAKLSALLLKHPSNNTTKQVIEIGDTTNLPSTEVAEYAEPFPIPEDSGQSVDELIEEVSPAYLRACLKTAQRALAGQVNPFKEGDLPHKIALMLIHKMTPGRKWSAKLPDEAPSEVKKTARALKSLIKSLSEEGEIVIDSTKQGMNE